MVPRVKVKAFPRNIELQVAATYGSTGRGDTVIDLPDYQSQRPYYQVCWQLGHGNTDSGRQLILGDPDQYPLITRPIDKEENYIKRCVAIAGDTLQIKDQVVCINGQAQPLPPESETFYIVRTKGQPLDETAMKEEYDVDMNKSEGFDPKESQRVVSHLTSAGK